MKVKVGDKVICVSPKTGVSEELTQGKVYTVVDVDDGSIYVINNHDKRFGYWHFRFELVRNEVKYTDWQLAKAGEVIPEDAVVSRGEDNSVVAYKVPVKPKVEIMTTRGYIEKGTFYNGGRWPGDNYYLTFNVIDGEPDCSSVKLEKL